MPNRALILQTLQNKMFVARTDDFLEREFVSKRNSGRKVELKETREPQNISEPKLKIEQGPQIVVDTEYDRLWIKARLA